ncbi:hypothetical protein MRX96_055822 [Rhipicephalus microplus]
MERGYVTLKDGRCFEATCAPGSYKVSFTPSDAGAPRCQATDLDASPGPRLDERDTDGLRLADLDLE